MSEPLHPEESITRFLLVRHGHTFATESGTLYSNPSAELTDRGRRQAQLAAAWLAQEQPQVVLASPSLRTRSTADIIAQQLCLEPILIQDLIEWQVGSWEDRTYIDIKAAEPDLYWRWFADPIRNAPPGGESIAELCTRAQSSWQRICHEYAGQTVVLVSHAEVMRAILVWALGMPVDNFWRIAVAAGSVTRLDASDSFSTLQYLGLCPEDVAGWNPL